MDLNTLKYHFHDLRLNHKFQYNFLAIMLVTFLILVALMFFIDSFLFLTIITFIAIVLQTVVLIITSRKEISTKKEKIIGAFTIIALGINVFMFISTSSEYAHSNTGSMVWANDTLNLYKGSIQLYWEESADFSRTQAFNAPNGRYYYLDYSNVSVGSTIVLTLTVSINVKPDQCTLIEARSPSQFQLDQDFKIVANHSLATWVEYYRLLNAVNTTVIKSTFSTSYTNNEATWDGVLMYNVFGTIDPAWIGDNFVSYLWVEFNFTVTENGNPVNPVKTGFSYNIPPLTSAVDDVWWLIAVSVGFVWLITFLFSFILNNTQTLWFMQLLLISISVICLFILIANELVANYVNDLCNLGLCGVAPFVAIAIASVRWLLCIGAIVILTTMATSMITKVMELMKSQLHGGYAISKKGTQCPPIAG